MAVVGVAQVTPGADELVVETEIAVDVIVSADTALAPGMLVDPDLLAARVLGAGLSRLIVPRNLASGRNSTALQDTTTVGGTAFGRGAQANTFGGLNSNNARGFGSLATQSTTTLGGQAFGRAPILAPVPVQASQDTRFGSHSCAVLPVKASSSVISML